MPKSQVIWLNGAFGAGKTTVARKLASLLPAAMTLDPEAIGGMLCRVIPASQRTADFQDLRTWRRLTVAAIEGVLQDHPGLLLVPMTVVDSTYFDETVGELRRSGIPVHHFTLVAAPQTIRRRLLLRLSHPRSTRWALQRVERCASALQAPRFATHLATDHRSVPEIAAAVRRLASI